MFCKSGILIFIFTENNYVYIPKPCLLKHLCSTKKKKKKHSWKTFGDYFLYTILKQKQQIKN